VRLIIAFAAIPVKEYAIRNTCKSA